MLYRQSLSVPPAFTDDVNEVGSPMSVITDEPENEEDIYLKAAEAGQRVLKLCMSMPFSSEGPRVPTFVT